MARPRKPTELLDPSAFKRNPNRTRPVGPKSGLPVGTPPVHLSELEHQCWLELVRVVPDGVLQRENRHILEMAARLLAETRTALGFEKASLGRLTLLKECLVQMGLTPAARSKVHVAKKEEKPSEYSRFLKPVRSGSA